jgi:hypothetical protein
MALRLSGAFGSPRLGNGRVGVSLGVDRITAPWIEIVTGKSSGDIAGKIRPPGTFGLLNATGRFRVKWWDGTTTETQGSVIADLNWSKAAGGPGQKVIRFYPITQSGTIASGDITRFTAGETELISVSVRGIANLVSLQLNKNELTSIDVTGCVALRGLDLTDNLLTSINLRTNTLLETLFVPKNSIEQLDLTGLHSLTFLSCYDNPIAALDVGGQPSVNKIDARDCDMQAEALNDLYESLPDRSGTSAGTVATGGNPGYEAEGEDQTIATNKNWAVTATAIATVGE